MAGGFAGGDAGAGRAAQYEGRITSYFILACIVGSFGGSLFGYDLGVSSGVTSMDDFLIKFFPDVYNRKHAHLHETDYCKYDNQVLTLFTSSLYFAGLVSTFGASFVTKRHGRRASIMVGAVSFFLGGAMNAAAMNLAMLIVGRVLLGAGIGFGNQAVPLYLSEIAPYKIRGAVNQLFQLTTCLGILVADVVNYFTDRIHPWGWRLSLGLAMVPATAIFVGALFLPETPNSLVERGQLEEARPRAGEGARDAQGGRRVRGPQGGERGGARRARHVPEPAGRAQPAAAHHRCARHPGVPAAVRHELHPLLLTRHLPEPRLRLLRVALLLHHHRLHAGGRRTDLNGRGRPLRPQVPLHRGRYPDDPVHGGGGDDPSAQVRARGGAVQGRGHGAGGGHLHVRGRLRLVVGPAGVAGAERAVPAGDAVGGAERGGVRQPFLDGRRGAVLPGGHVPPPLGCLRPLRVAYSGHVHLRDPPPAGDQAGAHRGDMAPLRQALVLEAHRHQGPQVPGTPPEARNGRRRRRCCQARRLVGIRSLIRLHHIPVMEVVDR